MADHQSQILRALLELDNRYISGNELARHFNISRPLYNNIQKLKQRGI
ncbi:HTH domain-containing protein [Lactobacillus helveticus]|nr:HTH domain-containing protein [Lactobacillus helveticus]MCO0807794.1 HTH domain-containing protein [Lactobacillus helveticus]